ncbi:tyrosyl-DNA phosphodiesterase [Diaporthe amygdali]|uniref:tyrosyl-DNA phosphodiesterase n=1 Tax=Phomopsis amygdali TaxID=1214568 RepID=UPI0022FEEF9E|nr:tyrosyl-DNA phosphodiesterase [Diaporthe amygdali]KAJ0114497.1 tyrosyl-DNA phosphodiesterase [Diaporthe amygdali]
MEPLPKRRRLSAEKDDTGLAKTLGQLTPRSLSHPVSPPRKRSRPQATHAEGNGEQPQATSAISEGADALSPRANETFTSPFQLTWIRDLPEAANTDAVTLRDILGDPLIAECWEFNYLHDIDFLISHFDEDIRHLVQVHVIHGFWKKEDSSRLMLQEQAKRHKNVTLHCAFMPEMFGTHHSKMLILIRHDDTAQVIIHTANMIARDWTNMTQALWRSPLLPLLKEPLAGSTEGTLATIGSGEKFKVDLLNYLRAYDQRRTVCKTLVDELERYNFSAIRAAMIASVPGRHLIHDESETRWGWAGLKQTLKNVPVQEGDSDIVVQISSIATLGPTDNWIRRTLFDSLQAARNATQKSPSFKVVFPTPDEIRRSLDGYESGGSIHTKIQSAQQAKQLLYLKPLFCHWANDAPRGRDLEPSCSHKEAGRKRAAPHIKTYIRYGEKSIDWALTTSVNLSKQAWGEAANSSGEVRIASWEIGVLVWPALFSEKARMVGTFQKDTPEESSEAAIVGLRIPYNHPLQAYGADEKPWVATASYHEPDWNGRAWLQ